MYCYVSFDCRGSMHVSSELHIYVSPCASPSPLTFRLAVEKADATNYPFGSALSHTGRKVFNLPYCLVFSTRYARSANASTRKKLNPAVQEIAKNRHGYVAQG